MVRDSWREYQVTLVLKVDPSAPFLELENGENQDVILELVKDQMYDLDDVKIREIEVEYMG